MNWFAAYDRIKPDRNVAGLFHARHIWAVG